MKTIIGIQVFRQAMVDVFLKYMASDVWQGVREAVIRESNGQCVDCLRQIREGTVHHTSYEDWGKGNIEEVMSCIYLCKKCDRKRHNGPGSVEVPFWAKRNEQCWGELTITAPVENSVCL
jgi:5-methylcytosine-specific restriction endonuclease McrA